MMRIVSSIVLGIFATIVAIMAAVGGWRLGLLIVGWIAETGTAEVVIVGSAILVVFLVATRYFYESVIFEESE